MRAFLAAAALAAASASGETTSTMLWSQNEAVAVYTTASVARQSGSAPTFSVATWLNQPVTVEAWTAQGDMTWQFNGSTSTTFGATMAHHAQTPLRAPTVDTFVVAADGTTCTLLGFVSAGAGATGTPTWTLPITPCAVDTLFMGAYIAIKAADDGSAVALQYYTQNSTGGQQTNAVVVNGQTGVIMFTYALTGVTSGQAAISFSPSGAWLALINEDDVNACVMYVINGVTGALRATVPMPFFIAATLSDDGNYAIVGDDASALLYTWSAGSSTYTQTATLAPASGSWVAWDIISIEDDSAAQMAIIGWISDDVLTLRITAYDLATQALVIDYTTPTNSKLQNNPSLAADQNYVGLASWGDSDDIPTVLLLKHGSNVPVFNYTTPGSMFGVDVVVDSSSGGTDVVYLTAAGKHVPANEFGNGGDAYAWQITTPTRN